MTVFLDPHAWQFWLGTVPFTPLAFYVAYDFGRWSAERDS